MGVEPLDRQVVHAATTFASSSGLRQTGSVVPRRLAATDENEQRELERRIRRAQTSRFAWIAIARAAGLPLTEATSSTSLSAMRSVARPASMRSAAHERREGHGDP
jgi:hypothetical protein